MALTADQPVAFGVPRLPPGTIARPRLTSLLDAGAPLTVIRGAGGRGKTTLVSQWLSQGRSGSEAVVWLDLEPVWRVGEDPWLRLLETFGHVGVLSAADLSRDLSAIGTDADQAWPVVRRIATTLATPLLVVLTGVPSPDEEGVTRWMHQVVDILLAAPQMRMVVTSESAQLFAGPLVRSRLEIVAIDDEQLALTEEEVAQMIAAHGTTVSDADTTMLTALATGATAAELRYLLALLETPGVNLADVARGELSAEVATMVRSDVLHTAANDAGWTFMGLISFAPAVTPALAIELTGDEQVKNTLESWVHAGIGHWTTLPYVGKAFRLADVFRRSASSDLQRDHPARAQQAKRTTARWLLDHARDPKVALRVALAADDLELVERAFMNSFSFAVPRSERPLQWLADIPAHRIHRHPFLALYRALQLNASARTRGRAIEFFVSGTLVGKFKSGHIEPIEKAFRLSLEGAAWRVLGRETTMVRRAREAVELVADARDAQGDQWAPAIALWALQQSATSLLSAGLVDEVNKALDLLEDEAARQDSRHFAAWARGTRALVQVLAGEVVEARKTLATISEHDWPDTHAWKNGYMQALHILALAWVELHDGKPAQALRTLARLDEHADTIEFWDQLLDVQVNGLILVGRLHEAEHVYRRIRTEREDRRTLSVARDRLNSIARFLTLAGAPTATSGSQKNAPILRSAELAATALAATTSGQHERAISALAEAESTATTIRDNTVAAVAGIAVGLSARRPDIVELNAARLATLVHLHGYVLPVTLLTQTERQGALAALKDSGGGLDPALHEQLLLAFDAVGPLTHLKRAPGALGPALTPSERELLVLLATGATRDELARRRFVSVNTIKTQLRSLYSKLEVKNRTEAVEKSLAMGLFTTEEIPRSE